MENFSGLLIGGLSSMKVNIKCMAKIGTECEACWPFAIYSLLALLPCQSIVSPSFVNQLRGGWEDSVYLHLGQVVKWVLERVGLSVNPRCHKRQSGIMEAVEKATTS